MTHSARRSIRHAMLATFLATGSSLVGSQAVMAQSARDPWLWPFIATSIWNTPIGSRAQYVPANLGTLAEVDPDPEFFVRVVASDPSQTLYFPGGPYRADGTTVSWLGSMQVPNGFLVPDVTLSPYSTPNDVSTFLQIDSESLVQLQPTTRVNAGGPIWGYPQTGENAGGGLHGDGAYGTHYGSGLSAIGGSIRNGEMSSRNPIRHAIKIELCWQQLFFNPNDPTNDYNTYIWPARNSDGCADGQGTCTQHYSGTNPALRQGSLLAILPTETERTLGLTTAAGKKLFHAIQNYGAYVVDTSRSEGTYVNIPEENGVQNLEITGWGSSGAFYTDFNAIYSRLQVVINNTAASIGGGGTPRAPQALPLGSNPTPTGRATYRLVNQVGGPTLALCLYSPGATVGANTRVRTCNGNRSEAWTLQDARNGAFALVNQQNGLCLDNASAGTTPGTKVSQSLCNSNATQGWNVTPAPNNYFTVTNQYSVLNLDDSREKGEQANSVWLNTPNRSASQNWQLEQQ